MGWAELRGIRTNGWKYIQAPKPELYDLVKDPGETTNVIGENPGEVRGNGLRPKSGGRLRSKSENHDGRPVHHGAIEIPRLPGRIFGARVRTDQQRHRSERPHRGPEAAVSRSVSLCRDGHPPADSDAAPGTRGRPGQPFDLLSSGQRICQGRTTRRGDETVSGRDPQRSRERLAFLTPRLPVSPTGSQGRGDRFL